MLNYFPVARWLGADKIYFKGLFGTVRNLCLECTFEGKLNFNYNYSQKLNQSSEGKDPKPFLHFFKPLFPNLLELGLQLL